LLYRLVRIEKNNLVYQVGANFECEVSASFDFSVRDSIDKNYIAFGSSTCSIDESNNTDI
jgi:hypothetical protein